MARQSSAIKKAIEGGTPHPDGRRERSRSSRSKIVKAMMELIAKGDINPSAARVAETAGVGLRSVFRHFDDKESLFEEIDSVLIAAYAPTLLAPYKSDHWKEQLLELVRRRAEVNEQIAPFRIATSIQRFSSKLLMRKYKNLLSNEHEMLSAILPAHIREDLHRARAILLAVSFDTWRLFRQDEELSSRKTVEVMEQLVHDIIDQDEE